MEIRDPHKAVDYILKNAKAHAKAKAERNYLEEYRKSLKAILMKQCLETALLYSLPFLLINMSTWTVRP